MLFLALCAWSQKASSGVSGNAEAKPFGGIMTPEKAKELLASEEGIVLLDVRTAEEFAAGHLPGAVNIDVESPDFAAGIASLDPGKPYALYCRSANRSKVAMTAMQAAGFTNLYDRAGGINAWKSAGGEVVTG